MVSSGLQCLTLSLFIIPPLLITTYFLAAFPNPQSVSRYSSLASLPPTCRSWSIYPEDYYPGGGYVSFPYGRTRFWLMGPEKGKKIVLIHGLSVPALIWKDVAPQLATRGYRVLLYDLYGRGYSDAPQTTYDVGLYTTQLALLMQYLKWDQAHIVGLSMGGAIAAAFTAHFSHLVKDEIALIASTGLIETHDLPRTAKFMSAPLIQTLTSSMPARKYLQYLTNSSTSSPDPMSEIVRIQSAHLQGYNAAISSSLRDGPIRGQAGLFSSPGFNKRRVLLIHGTDDTTVPYKYAPQILDLLPASTYARSQLLTIEGGRHDLTMSHAGFVVQSLASFFEGKVVKEAATT